MAKELKGHLQGQGLRIALVVARFNEFVTHRLLEGAHQGLLSHGVAEEDITIAWVPGSLELGLAAKALLETQKYDAVVCLGTVIRGETTHYDLVAGQTASGIARLALDTGVPVTFGVLTTENVEQAINRAGGKLGNKGYDAAVAAIEMTNLLRLIRGT